MQTKRLVLVSIFYFVVVIPVLIYLISGFNWVGLWCVFWVPGFLFTTIYSRWSLFDRGMLLISWTVLFAAIGVELIIQYVPERKTTVEMVNLMFVMLGGGIGGSFMAHDLIHSSDKNQSEPGQEES